MCLSAHYKYVHNFSFKGNQPEKKKKSYAVIKKKKNYQKTIHIITSQPFSAPIPEVFSPIQYQWIAEVTQKPSWYPVNILLFLTKKK